MEKEPYQRWWEEKWSERQRLIHSVFGETKPPNSVVAFYWDELDLRIPGACAMVFPPKVGERGNWVILSHGLTQPQTPEDCHGKDEPSGYGYEFAFLTTEQPPWAPDALQLLLTYLRQSGRLIERGHRVPFWFHRDSGGRLQAEVGKCDPRKAPSAVGEIRALVFWPYMRFPSGFETSTGYFTLLAATGITEKEWQLAKATSSAHLLLLLFIAGIGQVTDLSRCSVPIEGERRKEWERISSLTEAEAEAELLRLARRHQP